MRPRLLIIGGKEIVTGTLGSPLDQVFDQLHNAYFGNGALPWDTLLAAALQYFDKNPLAAAHDAFFSTFTIVWQSLLDSGRFDLAEHIWERALEPAHAWEHLHQGQTVHKGTPYYFWGMTALLRGDIDRGYFLIHRSFEEDILTSGQKRPDTPGYALVTLNDGKVEQAFRPWVIDQASFFEALMVNYNKTHGRNLTKDDVKRRFIDISEIDTVFLLTYTLARLIKLVRLPSELLGNVFAAQVEANLLFDIALVIDAAIKVKNPGQWQFIGHAEHLLAASAHSLSIHHLKDINGQFEKKFEATLQSALGGTLRIGAVALDRFQCDVALTYGLRNRGAHNIQSVGTISSSFSQVYEAAFRVLFSTIDYLY
jgi:hypothetical protein